MDFYLQAGVLLCKNMNTKICIKCGKEFERLKKRDNWHWEKQKYCSRECGYNGLIKHGFLVGKGDNQFPRTYVTWQSMKQRCYNKNHDAYLKYGGRGITVCDRWISKDGFTNFLNDMGVRPDDKTLDRIDNDGNYEPSNCRWATLKQQANNKRNSFNNKTLTYCGVEYPKREIIKNLSLKYKLNQQDVRRLIRNGKGLEDSINELLEIKFCEHLRELRNIKHYKQGKYTKRNKLIVELRLKYQTLEEVGEKLSVSRERIRQILQDVIKFDKKSRLQR